MLIFPDHQKALDFKRMQYRQEVHDMYFHHDIYTLPKAARLTHLLLHQVKYIGKLCTLTPPGYDSSEDLPSYLLEPLSKLAVDGVIICLSTANLCGDLLSDHLDLTEDHQEWVQRLVVTSGKIAKVLEDIDHLQSRNPLATIAEYNRDMFSVYTGIFAECVSPDHLLPAVYERLTQVEKKDIHYIRKEALVAAAINR